MMIGAGLVPAPCTVIWLGFGCSVLRELAHADNAKGIIGGTCGPADLDGVYVENIFMPLGIATLILYPAKGQRSESISSVYRIIIGRKIAMLALSPCKWTVNDPALVVTVESAS